MEGDTIRTRSEFENELGENMVQFARIRDNNISYYINFKSLCCINKTNIFNFYCGSHLDWNLRFCPYFQGNCTLFLSKSFSILDLVLWPLSNKRQMVHSHLTTTTQIFDVVPMSSEMGCIVTNVTVHTWRQKKAHRCRQVRKRPKMEEAFRFPSLLVSVTGLLLRI